MIATLTPGAVEEMILAALNVDHDLPVSLTDDRAMTREVSPYSDVQALKDYILELAAEHA